MMIDFDKKYLSVYGHSPKGEGQWFFALQIFRRRWEFGLDCDWGEYGKNYDMVRSRYYLYAQEFNREGLKVNQYEFPRKNRWTHVTN